MKNTGIGTSIIVMAAVAVIVVGGVSAYVMMSGNDEDLGEENITVSSISAASVKAGENATVSVKVVNSGTAPGSKVISLKIDGEVIDSKEVSVEADYEKTVAFTVQGSTPGNYTISASDKSVTWTVIEENEGDNGEAPPSSRYLNVPHIPQDDAICYLGCTAMIVKYYDRDIDLSDVIAYTGAATDFKDYTDSESVFTGDEEEGDEDFGPGEEEEREDSEEGEEESKRTVPTDYSIVPPTTKNLGYIPHMVYAGQPTGFVRSFNQVIDSSSLGSEGELIDRLKDLIASGSPAIVWLDNDAWWTRYFESITGGPEPLVVTGYDENYIYAHVSTTDPSDENRSVPVNSFSDGWGGQITPIILYLIETGEKKTDSEILSELKIHAENAPAKLRACADGIENGTVSLGVPGTMSLSFNLEQYGALRDNVSVYLREQGYEEMAGIFENSADKFWRAYETYEATDGGGNTPNEVAEILREIAEIENRAYNLWN